MKEERKTIKKAVLNVVRLLLIGVFLFSGYKIYGIFSEYENYPLWLMGISKFF